MDAPISKYHPLRMEYRYNLTVIGINQNRNFQRNNRTHYNYQILFTDQQGLQYMAEYVTPDPHQNEFVAGMAVCFRVSAYNNIYPEVIPIPNCKQTAEKVLMGDKVKPVMTESYGVGLKCATELMGAIIQRSSEEISIDDIMDKTISMAEEFDTWLLMRQTDRLVGDN